MWPLLLSIASGEAKAEAGAFARRAVVALIAGLVAAILSLFALAALLFALFFWLAPDHGPLIAALACAGAAFLLAIVTLAAGRLAGRPAPRRKAPLSQALDGSGGSSALTLTLGALILGLLVGRKV